MPRFLNYLLAIIGVIMTGIGLAGLRGNPELIAVGAAADDLVEVEQFKPARALTATFGPGLGVFLDRNNSLLVSLLLTPSKEDRAVLNVYPGVVGPGWLSPGVSLRWRHAGGMGVSVEVAPLPIGVGTVLGGARGPPP